VWVSTSQINRLLAFVRHWINIWEYNVIVYQPFVDFKKVYDSVWREVYTISS
jgi:hypothetical protein